MPDLEMRRAKRYGVAAPVDFWWPSIEGSIQASRGVTKNISSAGLLVVANQCPPVGSRIQLTVLLSRHRGGGLPLELHGEGTVVRVECDRTTPRGELESGFAAAVQFYPELPDASEYPGKDRSDA
jgi:hypothetical protein